MRVRFEHRYCSANKLADPQIVASKRMTQETVNNFRRSINELLTILFKLRRDEQFVIEKTDLTFSVVGCL